MIDEHKLASISEKPVQHFFVNAGIYVLSPEAVARIPEDTSYNMTTLFQALVDDGHETAVFPIREYWLDVGRINDLEQARGDYPTVFS